jgi:hypothetical protein
MKPTGIVGIILIAIGIIALAYGWFGGSFSYTTRENVAKLGPLKVDADKEHHVPIGPIVGGACFVGGIILVVAGGRGGRA